MEGSIYSTGNRIVDENARLSISGNVIPQMWYRTIIRESGKPNLTAIIILADIVYWYKPTEIRDEATGQVIAVKKKFKADLLQRSYQQISEQFGISKKEATNAVVFLEKLGVVKRVFRTITINGIVVNNVLYLELDVAKLKELTYPGEVQEVPFPLKRERGEPVQTQECIKTDAAEQFTSLEEGAVSLKGERVSLLKEIPVTVPEREASLLKDTAYISEIETNTEINPKTTTENTQEISTEINALGACNPILSYQTAEEVFKEQIDYDAIWFDRPGDRNLLNEIVSIAVDVLTSTLKTLRINREEKPTPVVQGIYKKLDKFSVEYVIDYIRQCGSKANNIRAVIMTALYNATMTANSYIANLFAYHEAIPRT